jgi:hypothetical protein
VDLVHIQDLDEEKGMEQWSMEEQAITQKDAKEREMP